MSNEQELRARILSAAAQTPSRTRTGGRARAAILYALAAVAMAAIFFIVGGFAHASARPASVSGPILAGEALIAIGATWLVFGRSRSMTGRAAGVLATGAVAVPALVFPWLTYWHGTYPEPFVRHGWACMGLNLLMAAGLFAALMFVRQRSDATHPTALGAAVGAVSGAWADLVVDAWCPLTNAPHVLLGHVAPMALLIAIGMLLGGRILAVKRR